jgi:transcription-repair coupling factor (superfamily II helicase)
VLLRDVARGRAERDRNAALFDARFHRIELMRLKTELRALRVLGCEASARVVTMHLREDTPLDPAKVMALVQKKQSPYRLTPDMRLSRRFAEDEVGSGLVAAEALLAEMAGCRRG